MGLRVLDRVEASHGLGGRVHWKFKGDGGLHC